MGAKDDVSELLPKRAIGVCDEKHAYVSLVAYRIYVGLVLYIRKFHKRPLG